MSKEIMQKALTLPSQKELHNIFEYSDGNLIWKNTNKIAGGISKSTGYCQITIKGVLYLAHRLIYMWEFGSCPTNMQIDHIDGNRSNNKIKNLRLATNNQNQHNVGKRKDNTSGYKGVSFNKQRNKFYSYIRIEGKLKYLGYFEDAKDAESAYINAAKQIHKNFIHKAIGDNHV